MRKKKKKNAAIFPPETGDNKIPTPSLQDPSVAAMSSAQFAGLSGIGQMGEEIESLCEDLRKLIWNMEQ